MTANNKSMSDQHVTEQPEGDARGSHQRLVMPKEQNIQCFMDSEIGMTMEAETIKQLPDGSWLASAKIGSIFGSEVDGELSGTGPTREVAMAALKQCRKDLNDSLWA